MESDNISLARPEIALMPRISIPKRVVPELSIGSTALSLPHSNSIGVKSLTRSKAENIDKHSQASDQLILDEYRSTELINSVKIPNGKTPYWFLDLSEQYTSHNAASVTDFAPVFCGSIERRNQSSWVESMEELLNISNKNER